MSRWRLFVAVAAVGAIGVLGAAQFALAVEPGGTVVFLIPADANQPDPPEGQPDGLIYHGGLVETINNTDPAGGCPLGSFPVQDATLVDPVGGQSGRIEGIITISETDPIPPGTKLKTLAKQNTCTIGATLYQRYAGIVASPRE